MSEAAAVHQFHKESMELSTKLPMLLKTDLTKPEKPLESILVLLLVSSMQLLELLRKKSLDNSTRSVPNQLTRKSEYGPTSSERSSTTPVSPRDSWQLLLLHLPLPTHSCDTFD